MAEGEGEGRGGEILRKLAHMIVDTGKSKICMVGQQSGHPGKK